LMETYGLTLVEAMACGTPVVAFRVGGIPEAAPDGQVGVLCNPLDTSALLNAIETLRFSSQFRAELGKAASELVTGRNSKTRFAAEFARLYQECLNAAGTPSTGQGSRSSPLQDEDEQKETKTTKDFVESYDK
jgi:glycosyltransferase involved in cell wall biosynthesis